MSRRSFERLAVTNFSSDLSRLVAHGSRFFNGLGSWSVFKDQNIDVAHWVALSLMAERQGMTAPQLARGMGISNARATSIATALKKSGHVQLNSESGMNLWQVSEAGQAWLFVVNENIDAELNRSLGKRGLLVHRTANTFQWLSKVILS